MHLVLDDWQQHNRDVGVLGKKARARLESEPHDRTVTECLQLLIADSRHRPRLI